ncbi:MAG: NGG1p interacting factor NIF3 [Candidatus Omnitrophota bacterium]
MKLKQLYSLVVKEGIAFDPRGRAAVNLDLQRLKKQYEKLTPEEKKYFDQERLNNPYDDTRILNGNQEKEIERILVGIDIEVGELLLADRLNDRQGKQIDLVMAHHPEGTPFANLYRVMRIQSDILYRVGVPITVAEGMMSTRISEIHRRLMPVNHMRVTDAAKILDFAFICVHTAADNAVTSHLTRIFEKEKPDTVEEVVEILQNIPEYRVAREENAGPRMIHGKLKNRAGKVFVDMTGGTEGAKDVFEKLAAQGIGTMVCMHLSEEHFKKAQKEHINIVIAGHISSDNLGINLILDKINKRSKIEIISCSGFRRITR